MNIEMKKNLYFGIGMAVLSVSLLISIPYQVPTLQYTTGGGGVFSPRAFPYFVLLATLLCSVILITYSLIKLKEKNKILEINESKKLDKSKEIRNRSHNKRDLVITSLTIICYLPISQIIGMTVGGMLLIGFLMVLFKVRPVYLIVILSVFIPVIINYTYIQILGVYMPQGILIN